MSRAREFWADIQQDIASAIDKIAPRRGTVDTVSQTLGVKIKEEGASAALGEYYARLVGPKLDVNDEVAYVTIGGKPLILGRIWRGASNAIEFDKSIVFEAGPVTLINGADLEMFNGNYDTQTLFVDGATGDASIFGVLNLNAAAGSSNVRKVLVGLGSPEGVKTANVGSLYLRTDGATGTAAYVKVSGTGNTGWAAIGSGFELVREAYDDTLRSTTSTTIYTDQVTLSVTLPDGTWTIEAGGMARIAHSVNVGNVDARVMIDGVAGTDSTRTAPSSGGWPVSAFKSSTGIASGSRTIKLQFKASTAGTAYMSNGLLIARFTRE